MFKPSAVCSIAVIFALAAIPPAVAQKGNKGVSGSSPGQTMQNTTPAPPKGASTLSPGSQIKDDPTPRTGGAKELAPGTSNPNKK